MNEETGYDFCRACRRRRPQRRVGRESPFLHADECTAGFVDVIGSRKDASDTVVRAYDSRDDAERLLARALSVLQAEFAGDVSWKTFIGETKAAHVACVSAHQRLHCALRNLRASDAAREEIKDFEEVE